MSGIDDELDLAARRPGSYFEGSRVSEGETKVGVRIAIKAASATFQLITLLVSEVGVMIYFTSS